ncbi:hypothetical protein BGW36DRAFT_295436 [Talaromyces proteolyticus]|uniref:Uncharacterized protein n=1 Tax=Talaromyces proteolyticus TaxID=1131652 RepID=A0AAD4PWC3_9EURO|nr:uncharacterized protein BGW36DRAFT_295436 [Talaromyces proteolyticus]KAH8697695.1 hypothetical protein BGW36DRAFT_295436 [Talaromyces proteolyticus]
MIPLCDPSVLDNNPQFKRLYQHLTKDILNPNGTTRADQIDPARKAVAEELRGLQVSAAKKEIIRNATKRAILDSRNALPKDLQENHMVISLFLDDSTTNIEADKDNILGDDATALLKRNVESFYSNIHMYAPYISRTITSDIDDLRSIANLLKPTATTSALSGRPLANRSQPRSTRTGKFAARESIQPRLSLQITERMHRLRELQISKLPASRRQMAVTAASVLAARAAVIERMIVLLEQTKHGVLCRAMKAQADHLATVAEGMSGKAEVIKLEALTTIYTPKTTAALEDYREHLRRTRLRLEEKQSIAIQTLEEYGEVGTDHNKSDVLNKRVGKDNKTMPGPMADIARRYGALVKEVETVKTEMKRLEI